MRSAPAAPLTRAAGALTLLCLIAFGLRLLRLDALGDLEFDEIVSVRYAALAPDRLVPALSSALFEHPPLYYLLLGGWLTALGVAPATAAGDLLARVLSVIPGTLLVPLAYATGRQFMSERVGVIAAALISLSPLPLFYSREARMYELTACLSLAGCWLYARAAARPHLPARWTAFAAVGIAVVLVHYAGLLVVLAQPIAARRDRERRSGWPSLAAIGAVLVATGGWVVGAAGVRQSLPALEAANLGQVPAALWQTWRELAGGPESGGWQTAVAGPALAVLILLGTRFARRAITLSFAAGLLALAIAALLGKPAQARYLLVAAPFATLLAAVALARGSTLARALLGVVLVLGVAPWAAGYYTTYRRADYGDITRFIAAYERPGDAILLTGPWQAWYFDYYYPRSGGTLLHTVLPENAPPPLDPGRADAVLRDLAASRRRVWFVQAGLAQADPTNFVEGWLRRRTWPAFREAHQNAVLSLFALEAPEERRPLREVTFGGALRLVGGWIDGDEVPAGDAARLQLELEALRPLSANFRASLRLVGSDGQRLTQDIDLRDVERTTAPTSTWKVGERVTVRQAVWVPVSTNPQPYDVRLVVYDGATLEPLMPDTRAADQLAGEVSIGGVYVTKSRSQFPPPKEGYAPLERTFGGGDEFEALHLVGVGWHQRDPASAPLTFDLLWQMNGASGTLHYTVLTLRDARGAVITQSSEPVFSGSFAMRDWRPGETLGERRTIDATSLPAGAYPLTVRLFDARGRQLPVEGSAAAAEVELRRFRVLAPGSFTQRLIDARERAQRRLVSLFPPRTAR